MTELRIVQAAIERYAIAYAELQQLQTQATVIPTGDQKTGCIGEFYARLYLLSRYPSAQISFAGHSQSGWDIEVSTSNETRRFQVKTISAHSATRRISPISHGWDELLIVYLDVALQPAGFWVVTDTSIVQPEMVLRHCCSPKPGHANVGSRAIPFGKDRIEELQQAVRRALEA